MDKKRDCRTRLAQHRRLQFEDNLCNNVAQAVGCTVCVPNLQKRPDPPWHPLSPYPVITESAAHPV